MFSCSLPYSCSLRSGMQACIRAMTTGVSPHATLSTVTNDAVTNQTVMTQAHRASDPARGRELRLRVTAIVWRLADTPGPPITPVHAPGEAVLEMMG